MMSFPANLEVIVGEPPTHSTYHARSFTLLVGAGVWMRLDFLILETPTTSAGTSLGGAIALRIPVALVAGLLAGRKE